MGGSQKAIEGAFDRHSTTSEHGRVGKAGQAVTAQVSGRGQVRARVVGSGGNGTVWVRALWEEAAAVPYMARHRKGHAVLDGVMAACQSGCVARGRG